MLLRLTKLAEDDRCVILKLEGRLDACTVRIVQEECDRWIAQQREVNLDLAGLTYADPVGIAALARLQKSGVRLLHCSTLVHDMLRAEERLT